MFTHLSPAAFSWKEFWRTDIISGWTINFIPEPETGFLAFPVLLLLLALVIFLALLALKRSLSGRIIFVSAVASLTTVAFLHAFRMDYNWASMLKRDAPYFYNADVGERFKTMNVYDFHRFTEEVKKAVPEGQTLRTIPIDREKEMTAHYLTLRGNYYLLPVMTSREGRFIWVYAFHEFSYDPDHEVLEIHGLRFRARLYRFFDGGGMLFEVLEGRP